MKIPIFLVLITCVMSHAAVQITVEADAGHKDISPYIYGKNDAVRGNTSDSLLTVYKDVGLRIMRSNGGNNSSKYNWRRHLGSHPDWYNNVYDANWDEIAQGIQTKLPEVSGMFAFQLTGWAAANKDNNFDDWGYNQAQYWEGVHQNLAGGGVPNPTGGVAKSEGDPSKYLMPWPADSTAAILPYWFGQEGLGLDSTRFRYWNMDNEVGIWLGTHDDIYPIQPSPEEFIQKYKAVALAVRAQFPGVKLVAPASATEWQWWTWAPTSVINYKGRSVSWPEFFIWRLSEIQDSTGVRMLDVYDAHLYMGNVDPIDLVQQHRVLFDTTYEFANANGVRFAEGSWNGSEKKEYLFERINRWLDQYFGPDHGVGLGASESAIGTPNLNSNLSAVWQASFYGTFADHGVELFTPWGWEVGQYEVMHLFSKKGFSTRVLSTSSLDSLVSAYSSIADSGDSMTVILVNRDLSNSQDVELSLNGFESANTATKMQLSHLPEEETFISESQNALVSSVIDINNSALSLTLPSLSVTALRFKKLEATPSSSSEVSSSSDDITAFDQYSLNAPLKVRNIANGIVIEGTVGTEVIEVYDLRGNLLTKVFAHIESTPIYFKDSGLHILRLQNEGKNYGSFISKK